MRGKSRPFDGRPVRFKKTITAAVVASLALLVGAPWSGCTSVKALDRLARLKEIVPAFASSAQPAASPAPSVATATPTAMAAVPAPGVGLVASAPSNAEPSARPPTTLPPPTTTVAEVLHMRSCSTEVVRGLSAQIISEAACLRPNAFRRLASKVGHSTTQDVVFPFLAPPAHDALVAALEKGRREPMTINSMLRTVAQQYLLHHWYKRGRCHIKLAATPGTSNHQSGLALDIAQPNRWRARLSKFGFRWMGAKDRWHFDFVGRDANERAQVRQIAEAHAGLDVRAFQRLWNLNHPDEFVGESGVFDERTESALRRAPAGGFPQGSTCAK